MKKESKIRKLEVEISALNIMCNFIYRQNNVDDKDVIEVLNSRNALILKEIKKKQSQIEKLKNGTYHKPEYCECIATIHSIYDCGNVARISLYIELPDGEVRHCHNIKNGVITRRNFPKVGQKVRLQSRKTKSNQKFDKYNAKIVEIL